MFKRIIIGLKNHFQPKDKRILDALSSLIEASSCLSLKELHVVSARDYLKHHEFGLCFEFLLSQMHEDDIEIDIVFYELIVKVAKMMSMKEEEYVFMKDLVRDNTNIPESVKQELANIVRNLRLRNI